MKKAGLLLILIGVMLLTSSVAGAEAVNWNNALGGSWNNAANWTSAAVPVPIDDVIVNVAGTITVDYEETINSLTLDSVGNSALILGTGKLSVVSGAVSATIGSAGGTITGWGVILTVPPGAFSTDALIIIAPSNADGITAASLVGSPAVIYGLPDNFSLPIEISISHSETLSGELYISIGTDGISKSHGNVTVYEFLPAVDDGGHLKVTIPARSTPAAQLKNAASYLQANGVYNSLKVILLGVKDHRTVTCSNSLFTVFEPIGVRRTTNSCNADTEQVCDLLQNIINQYTVNYGFDDIENQRLAKNLFPSVSVQILGDPNAASTGDSGGYWIKYWSGSKYLDVIELNASDYYRSCDAFKETLAHEVFHMVQQSYEPIRSLASLWVDEATATYFEELLQPNPAAYKPINSYMDKHGGNNRPYSLSLLPNQDNWARHGYGVSPFVKYLMQVSGIGWLHNSYANINQNTYPTLVENFLNPLNVPIDLLWQDYLYSYLRGQVYGVDAAAFADLKSDKGILRYVSNASELAYSFTETYQSLSAKIYEFPIALDSNPSTFPAIYFKVSGGGVKVFEVPSAGKLIPLSTSVSVGGWDTSSEISNIAELMSRGSHLLAVVVNYDAVSPYTQTKEITLTIAGNECINDLSTGIALCWDKKDSGNMLMGWVSAETYCSNKGKRLPTINELVSFATEGEVEYIEGQGAGYLYGNISDLRPRLTARGYEYSLSFEEGTWSSSPWPYYAMCRSCAMGVYFNEGRLYGSDKVNAYCVRCVGSGQ